MWLCKMPFLELLELLELLRFDNTGMNGLVECPPFDQEVVSLIKPGLTGKVSEILY